MRKPDWDKIARHYFANRKAIFEAGRNLWGIDPHAWEFEAGIEMTPIERGIWHDIRCHGLVMYPQYHVAGYFVDFASPVAKVAIECDGYEWHTDNSRDKKRQDAIEAKGWTVYRIAWRECLKDDGLAEDEYGNEKTVYSEAGLLVRMVRDRHNIGLGATRCGLVATA
jgi:very-short-patch-repair endonuclease